MYETYKIKKTAFPYAKPGSRNVKKNIKNIYKLLDNIYNSNK